MGNVGGASSVDRHSVSETQSDVVFAGYIPRNYLFFHPSNPTGTTSTTYVMMGLGSGITLKPSHTGRIRISLNANLANSTAGDGSTIQLVYGTGTAPANGVAAVGTAFGNTYTRTLGTANRPSDVSTIWELSGLDINTTYWFDIQLEAVTGGTASISNITGIIEEV